MLSRGWLGCLSCMLLHGGGKCGIWLCIRSEESHRKPSHRGFDLWLKARQSCIRINLLSAKPKKVSQLSPPQTSTTFPLSLISQLKIGWQRDCGVSSWSRAEPVAIETNEPLSSICLPPLPVDLFFPLVHGGPVWGGRRSPTPSETQLPAPVATWDASIPSGSASHMRKGRGRMDFRWKKGLSFKACTYAGFSPSPWHLVFLLC